MTNEKRSLQCQQRVETDLTVKKKTLGNEMRNTAIACVPGGTEQAT